MQLPRGVLSRLPSEQSAQGMVEFALILALVALVVIVALLLTGAQVMNLYSNITATMCSYHVGC
ncbi:MAG: Flp family type IVb pilin [Chloroflexi bacterium]|nr:MAG: Flp family type IVb pilin [Chloroflexota bacterium]TME40898.1 MAG: Flp family type IVb pilin [Chloroflexota bacterium]TME53108.1 MAG: Flp family type IVb pilin [Chloroflexota bacterium]